MAFAVAVVWRVKPGFEAEAEDLLRENQAHSLRESGCLYYWVHRTEDPATFLLYEQYQDEAAFEAHRESDHFRRLITERGLSMLAEDRLIIKAETV